MNLLPRVLGILAAAALSLPAAFGFEGRVHFDMISGRDRQTFVYAIDGNRARMEFPSTGSAAVATIIDLDKQEMMMLMGEQKMYMTMSLQEANAAVQKTTGSGGDIEIIDTGETETILGRKTRKFRTKDRRTTTDIWAAEGMGTFVGQLGASNPMKKSSLPQWQQELGAKGFFPLRLVVSNNRGKETMRMEATKIEEVSLPENLFTVPEDYQRFDLGGMMRGLIPGMK